MPTPCYISIEGQTQATSLPAPLLQNLSVTSLWKVMKRDVGSGVQSHCDCANRSSVWYAFRSACAQAVQVHRRAEQSRSSHVQLALFR